MDRLTGGMQINNHPRPSPMIPHGLRNDSYYMATKDTWSPSMMNGNSSVLIEEDPEPLSPYVPLYYQIHLTVVRVRMYFIIHYNRFYLYF